MSSPPVDDNNIELDNFDAQKVGKDEIVGDEAMDIDSHTDGISNKKKSRGRTKCKLIHSRNIGEREEVTFFEGQAEGPTGKRVSKLSSFLGTIARNPRFVTLLFTSWHAVPEDTKQRMWNYVRTKFIIPAEGKKWVMDGIRDAWRQQKISIKRKKFDVNCTIEEMLQNRPADIPEDHFRQLIEYWKDKDVQARSKLNSERRKKGGIGWDLLILQELAWHCVQLKRTTRNHQSQKYLLQLVQRRESKFMKIPKLQ